VEESHKPIAEWVEVFNELYSKVDSKRTPEQMWTAVMAHTSSIGESIRKVAFKDLMRSAAHTLCWLCSFVSKCNELLDDDVFKISESLCGIVSLKYPNKCGHCIDSPCRCDPVEIESETDKSVRFKKLLTLRNQDIEAFEIYSIGKYREMFNNIYRARGHIQTLESIGFHFLEEIGEAAVNIRKLSQLRNIAKDDSSGIDEDFLKQLLTIEKIVEYYDEYYKDYFKEKNLIKYTSTEPNMLKARIIEAKMGLVSEIGDSFSWFCGVLNKVDSISRSIWDNPENHNIRTLEQELDDEYIDPDGIPICPTCKRNPCECVFYILNS